jgi:hypothetical protein
MLFNFQRKISTPFKNTFTANFIVQKSLVTNVLYEKLCINEFQAFAFFLLSFKTWDIFPFNWHFASEFQHRSKKIAREEFCVCVIRMERVSHSTRPKRVGKCGQSCVQSGIMKRWMDGSFILQARANHSAVLLPALL